MSWRDRARPAAESAQGGWRARAEPEDVSRIVAPDPSGISEAGTTVGKALASFPFADEIAAAMLATKEKAMAPYPVDWTEAYRQSKGMVNRNLGRAAKENPKSAMLGNVIGFAGNAALPIGAAGGAASKGLGALAKAGAKTGAKWGALGGFDASDADLTRGEFGEALKDTGVGTVFGAATGSLLPLGGRAVSSMWRGMVQPNAAGRTLRDMGANDLTLGQLAPGSWANGLEEASQSLPIFGELTKAQRQAGRGSWQNLALNEARAPGTAPVDAGTSAQEALQRIASEFNDSYGFVRGAPVQALAHGMESGRNVPIRQAFTEAINDPGIVATPGGIETAGRFLGNQAGLVERQRAFSPEPLTAAALIAARSNIRTAGRLQTQRQGHELADLFGAGEDTLTQSLESQLPEHLVTLLRSNDRQYSKFKTVEEAMAAARDRPGGFTPNDLSGAVSRKTGRADYAQGGGGNLRDLASLGRETLDSRSPPTGARLAALASQLPWMMPFANMSGPKRFMLGEMALQGNMSRLMQQRSVVERLLRAQNQSSRDAGEYPAAW